MPAINCHEKSMKIDIRQTVNFHDHFNNHLIQKIENRIQKYQNKDRRNSRNTQVTHTQRKSQKHSSDSSRTSSEETTITEEEYEQKKYLMSSSMLIAVLLVLALLLWTVWPWLKPVPSPWIKWVLQVRQSTRKRNIGLKALPQKLGHKCGSDIEWYINHL